MSVPLLLLRLVLVFLSFISTLPTHAQELPAKPTDENTPAEVDPRAAKRDALREKALRLRDDGKHAEALVAAQQMLAIELDWLGEDSEKVNGTLKFVAEIAELGGDWNAAIKFRTDAYQWHIKYLGSENWQTTDARLALAAAQRISELTGDQKLELKLAEKQVREWIEFNERGEYSKALERATVVVDAWKRLLGEQHPAYATSLSGLAFLYHRLGDDARAELLHKQALQIRLAILGEQHPDYATSLNNLAGLYENMSDYARAEPLYAQALELRKQVLGEQHPSYATSLNNLAFLNHSMGNYARAASLYTQALELRKQVLGEQHPEYASSLNNLAGLYDSMGDYAQAEPLYTQALELRKQVLGEQHPEYASSLNNLAGLYDSMGDYARAESLYTQALELRKQVLGEEHSDYATSLNNLAGLYFSMGDYARAEPFFTQAMQIKKQVLGEQHPAYATTLNNLASLYNSMGDYAQAEPLHKQALQIRRAVLGEQHPDYASSLNNLAGLYVSMADYARAEPLYTQAMQIRKAALGEQHPYYATSLNNLATLYKYMGDYARAEPLYTQAMQIYKDVLGEQHPEFASSVNNLAELYEKMDDYARAEPLYTQAMQIRQAALGVQHPDYATSLNDLAGLYKDMHDYARAEPLYTQSMQIYKEVLGVQHPTYAASLNNLAGLYGSMGDFVRAELLYTQAIQIKKQVLGEQHPSYATSLNNLAFLYASMGDQARAVQAVRLYEQALAITRKSLNDTAYVLSERQQLAMNQSLRYQFDNYLDACLAMPSVPPQAVENVMLWKGSVLYRLRGLRIAADDPSISEQFGKLQRAAAHLSKLVQVVPEPQQAVSWKQRVAELTVEKEVLEAELMRSSAAFREAVQQVTMGQIQQSIPEDGVLVDYLEFAGEHGRSLLASIVKRDAVPVMISLGSASEVSQAIDVWRETFGMSPQAKAAGLKLRQQIWEPVLAHLGSAKTILVSTDGVLGRLPFAALPGKAPDTYLIEDHRLALIPVPQLLPALVHELGSKKLQHEMLLIGDVNYDEVTGEARGQTPETSQPRKRPWERSEMPQAVRGDHIFNALIETRAEVEFIAGLYNRLYQPAPEAMLDLRQAAASESAFRAYAPECAILHLATHGFFAAPEQKSAMSAELVSQHGKNREGMSGQEQDALRGYSPGQLSGIVFAGANRKPNSALDPPSNQDQADDGIMTADEIAFMRLEGVRLAVLSACETGLGEVAGGEGLLGIQRGFQMAGARSTVASLWKVNDAATRRLMQEFYTNYLDKEMSMLDALRQTQLWALNHPSDVPRGMRLNQADAEPTRLDPQFWAPFVLSGDWR